MSRQNSKQKRARNHTPGSGTEYHKKHASHVPGYGANTIDPNTEK